MNKKYCISLKQHIGAINTSLVKYGERVEKGALIAVPNGLGANIHASVSGRILEVTDQEIVIEADAVQPDTYRPLSTGGSIIDIIKEAGIVGMGGAGFPTHVKMNTDLEGGVVIANGVECEPILEHNIQQLIEHSELIYRGLKYAMKAVNASRGIFAIKAKNVQAINAVKAVITDECISITELPDLYPMGEERAIVREVLGQLIGPGELPSAVKAVVSNVETLSRIAEAVDLQKPVITKNITVAGHLKSGCDAHVFMDVPIGTSIKELIEAAGGINGNYGEIILGGPFTGQSVSIEGAITKTSGGILVTIPFPQEKRKMGLLVCACGATEARLRELADKMGAKVVSVEFCKQVVDVRGAMKCENPGNCPGQAEKILKLRKAGAEVLLVSNCSDCTNTVMGVAPKLNLPVYHHTDHVLRSVNHVLVRRLKSS